MRLRRAVLKIPPKSSVPPRSPLYKLRPLPTPSESTLPQVLIPLHFKSFISNTYKKTGRGSLRQAPKFVNSSLSSHHSCAHTARPATPIRSIAYFTTIWIPGGWGGIHRASAPPTCHLEGTDRRFRPCRKGSASLLLPTDHGPRDTRHYSVLAIHSQITAPPYSRKDSDSPPP